MTSKIYKINNFDLDNAFPDINDKPKIYKINKFAKIEQFGGNLSDTKIYKINDFDLDTKSFDNIQSGGGITTTKIYKINDFDLDNIQIGGDTQIYKITDLNLDTKSMDNIQNGGNIPTTKIYKLNNFDLDNIQIGGNTKTYKLKDFNIQIGGARLAKGGSPPYHLTDDQIKQIYNNQIKTEVNENVIGEKYKEYVKATYGEILYDSLEKLINTLNLNEDDVFYDLGSGNGKVILQVYTNSPVKKAYGVEFFPERSYMAEKSLKKLYLLYPKLLEDERLISFQLQNIKDIHYLDDATVIFMCSTCYPTELLDSVYDKIKKSPNIRAIITHKEYDNFKSILPEKTTITLPCTWNNNLTWFIYSKSPISTT